MLIREISKYHFYLYIYNLYLSTLQHMFSKRRSYLTQDKEKTQQN